MLNTIITSAPMYICGTLSVLLGLSICYRWDRARFLLLIFMLAATLLYMGHLTFFNRIISVIPITDTLYCFCNPAVFPLFLIYIEELVLKALTANGNYCISYQLLYAESALEHFTA